MQFGKQSSRPRTYREKSWVSPKIEERNSLLHGRGLFAKETVRHGETVLIWGGDFVSTAEAMQAKRAGKAVQQIDRDLWDVFDYASRNDDPSYNHNHSCDPNTWMQDEVTIIARHDILAGEELTIDYAFFTLDDSYVMRDKCKCGAAHCRRVITGKDWQKEKLQKEYSGHFSPYLNEKIKVWRWFTDWARLKPQIHFSESDVYFRERQIWWASVGQNIGSEENGKHGNFEHPVIVLKKFNPQTFLAVPISTAAKEGTHRLVFTNNEGRFIANLSQMRVLSSQRLLRLVGVMPSAAYARLQRMYREMM